MFSPLVPLHRALWQYQPGTHDPNPPLNIEATSINGAASAAFDLTLAADGAVAIVGAASGSLEWTIAADGDVSVAGAASGDLPFALEAVGGGASQITGEAAGSLDWALSAAGTSEAVEIRLYRGDDAPDWRKQFYDRQIREFEATLEAIPKAPDPQDAAQEAVEAFEPIAERGEVRAASQAISEALRGMTMHAMRRKEMQREMADIRAELALIAAYRRKRRNNDAAMLLLM